MEARERERVRERGAGGGEGERERERVASGGPSDNCVLHVALEEY